MSKNRYKFKKNLKASHFLKRSAIEVLHDQMVFYEDKGLTLLLAIKREIKENSSSRGDLLVSMTKNLLHCKDMAIECAHKLAPYQAPKLQSIEVKKKITHKFVIQGPDTIKDSNIWLKQVEETQRVTPQALERAQLAPPKINNQNKFNFNHIVNIED